MGFCADRSYECAYKIWSSWDNWLSPQNLDSPWIRPCSLSSQIFNWLLFELTLWMYVPNLKSLASPVPEIVATALYFLGGCEPKILGKRRPQGVGVVSFERAFVSSYRPSIVTDDWRRRWRPRRWRRRRWRRRRRRRLKCCRLLHCATTCILFLVKCQDCIETSHLQK